MTYETLLVDNDGSGLLTVSMNRPAVMNAADTVMVRELAEVFGGCLLYTSDAADE